MPEMWSDPRAKPSDTPVEGDFAAHVKREYFADALSPGEVPPPQKQPDAGETLSQILNEPHKSGAGWFVSLAKVFAFGSISYLALTTGEILLKGRRKGGTFYEGTPAVVIGFVFLALALLPLVLLAWKSRLSRLVFTLAASLWLAVFISYYAVRGAQW